MIKKLQLIIGRNVLGSESKDTIQLAKLASYWHTQLNILKKDSDSETKEYIDEILKSGEEFLNI